jgi:hypothetical protein
MFIDRCDYREEAKTVASTFSTSIPIAHPFPASMMRWGLTFSVLFFPALALVQLMIDRGSAGAVCIGLEPSGAPRKNLQVFCGAFDSLCYIHALFNRARGFARSEMTVCCV